MTKSIPEMSADTRLLIQRLDKAEPGEVISYDDLSEVIGRDVRNGCWHYLTTARWSLLRESGKVFATVRGEGVKRLTDAEIPALGAAALAGIGRKARRADRQLAAVKDFDSLPEEVKVQHQTSRCLLAVAAAAARPRSQKQIAGKVEEARQELPLAKTLEALRG